MPWLVDIHCLNDLWDLQKLADTGEPPTDPAVAAELLRRWIKPRIDCKPKRRFGPDRGEGNYLGFLCWLLRDVREQAYQRVKSEHPWDAAEIRRQILTLCFWSANSCMHAYLGEVAAYVEGVSLGRPDPDNGAAYCLRHADRARQLPKFALGADDAWFETDRYGQRRWGPWPNGEATLHGVVPGCPVDDEVAALKALSDRSVPCINARAGAALLRRWMRIPMSSKPGHHYKAVADSPAGFLFWALGNVGDKAYRRLKIQHPKDAAEVRRQVLTRCFYEANRWDRPTAWIGRGLQSAAIEKIPVLVLGTADASF